MKSYRKFTIKRLLAALLTLCFVFVPIFGLVYSTPAYAGVPRVLSYQGRLTNSLGNLLGGSGTNYYFKFNIYSSLSGGSSLWSSGGTAITISVTQGVFNTLLGDTSVGYNPLDLAFDSDSYYLEVQVSSNNSSFETLAPRQRIVSSGFAINADMVHGGRFLNATGVGQFAGLATASYSRFGVAVTSHPGTISSASDLLISGGLEVNGSAAFDGPINFGAIASNTAAGDWNFSDGTLVIDSGTRRVGVGTSDLSTKFNILDANSVPQFRLGESASIYSEFYTDAAGDLRLSATGGNIRQDDDNLWVCSGGGCGVTNPADTGNVILENSLIFDNKFKMKKIDASTVIMYDSTGSATLQFDEGH